jgi:hypothetical protein
MNNVMLYLAFGLFVLALLAVLLWPRRARQSGGARSDELSKLAPEDLAPSHAKYFPLVRHALSGSDLAELGARIPRHMRGKLRSERRKLARSYLEGLHEDFTKLERFGRMVAAHSPKVDARQEAERVRLGIRFRLVHALLSLRLAIGQMPVPEFERLTQLVAGLATRLEASMTSVVESDASRASANLGA